MRTRISFKLRPFVSYFLTLSFIHLILSSVVLYIAPPGRFANWANWKILGITKGGWEAQHTIMGYLFIIAAVVHLVLNWKVFLSYIRSKMKKAVNRILEFIAAVLLVIIITLGTLLGWVPFSTVMNAGEELSNSWEANSSTGLDQAEVKDVENESSDEETTGVGQGMGKKDLGTVIEENGIGLESALEKLKNKGIDASPEDNMKDLSTRYNIGFSDIITIITE